MKKILLGLVVLLSAYLAHGGGDALYRQGAAVYKSDPAQAFGLFVQAAAAGNPSAMAGVGHCFETGTGTSVDYAKAIDWYEKAVEHNSLKACEGLARIYASCDDPEFHDGEKAVKYATAIARKKPRDAESLALLAAAHARNIDFEKAEKVQRTAQRIAPLNDSKEYKRQISKYVEGEPLPLKATEEWILRAANADALWAVAKLAHWASDPDGELYNPQLALKMCQKGIDKGRFDLSILKGNLYLDAGDLDKAYDCYREAASHGSYSVETRLCSHLKGTSEKVFLWAKKYRDGYEERYTKREFAGYENNGYDRNGNPIHGNAIYKNVEKVRKHPPCRESALYLFKIAEKKGHPKAAEALWRMERDTNEYKQFLKNKK